MSQAIDKNGLEAFDAWFHEIEGYALRSERFDGDVGWLKAAFAAQPVAWVVRLRYGHNPDGTERWSGEMLTDVLPDNRDDSYQLLRPLYASPPRNEEGGSRDQGLEEAARVPTPVEDRLGAWLSAALEDPHVAASMKDDINAWFAEIDPSAMQGGAQ